MADEEIPLSDGQMEMADGPAEQAKAVLRAIAGFASRYNTEQIAVGVADERMVADVEQRLRQCGIPVRYGVGASIAYSAPFRLLAAAADYLETSNFSALAALVRHPWIHEWLLTKISGDWLQELDLYQSKHIPHVLGAQWQGEDQSRDTVERVYKAIQGLCRPLQGPARPWATGPSRFWNSWRGFSGGHRCAATLSPTAPSWPFATRSARRWPNSLLCRRN